MKTLIQQVCSYIEANLDNPLTLEELSQYAHVSPYHLQRKFKETLGITPRQYVDACRMQRLKSGLRNGSNVTEALYEAGYGSSSRVYERSNAILGMTPSTYGKGGKGMHIFYTVTTCKLGNLLVAATERGLCAVRLGDDEQTLQAELKAEFYNATIMRFDDIADQWVQPILDYLEGWQNRLVRIPLDIQATAFQTKVWQTLLEIPYGETRTYGEIAESIGQPKAARAVARAIATNPVALVIPCHRVIGKSGDLTGYRWGTERKKVVLEIEQQHKDD